MCACDSSFVCSRCKGTPFDPHYLLDEPDELTAAEFARQALPVTESTRGNSDESHAAATERRISVVAWIEISVDVEADENADLLGTGIAKQAVQDAIGHTGAVVDFVDRWSWDD